MYLPFFLEDELDSELLLELEPPVPVPPVLEPLVPVPPALVPEPPPVEVPPLLSVVLEVDFVVVPSLPVLPVLPALSPDSPPVDGVELEEPSVPLEVLVPELLELEGVYVRESVILICCPAWYP